MKMMIHPLHMMEGIEGIDIPEAFTYPFHYSPHGLTRLAAGYVTEYLGMHGEWQEEIDKGKMFGVLIVRTPEGEIGYLAAFSGNLAGSNYHDFFVPPVYDLLNPDGFFRIEEKQISAINVRIKEMECSSIYKERLKALEVCQMDSEMRLKAAKAEMKAAKKERDRRRKEGIGDEEEMIRESQYQKAELKRLERQLATEIEVRKLAVDELQSEIRELKEERKKRSAALQMKLFKQFVMLNAKGEAKDLCEIFADTKQGIPPAGTGECALPKMLQYAYANGLKPLAMGEFWMGRSPKKELRQQGHFYPSCKSKCEPILKHMLVGLEVEANPLTVDRHRDSVLPIVYEDEWMVAVNKPESMLSVPGKNGLDSVYQRMRDAYPEATGPLIVHRLDMATSGLLVIAKTKEMHEALQELFEKRLVKKKYVALLDGVLKEDEGRIDLPLCPDIDDRPRQMVDYANGKTAVTLYKVLWRRDGKTLVEFVPVTGRTHQLRVHAAHPAGLGCPIVGDELYGTGDKRLYLHAEEIGFVHPMTGMEVRICCKNEFF